MEFAEAREVSAKEIRVENEDRRLGPKRNRMTSGREGGRRDTRRANLVRRNVNEDSNEEDAHRRDRCDRLRARGLRAEPAPAASRGATAAASHGCETGQHDD